MANINLVNLARMTVASTGTGTITLSNAVTGFLSFDLAGCSTAAAGSIVRYAINESSQSEIGFGTYISSALTLSRGSSTQTGFKTTNSNSPINMANTAQVFVTEAANDFPWVVDSGGTTATASLIATIAAATPTFNLNKSAAGTNTAFFGQTGGLNRWRVTPGNNTAEGGANAGSDFSISRYDDAGALIAATLTLTRSNGLATFASALTAGGTITTTQASTGNPAFDTTSATMSVAASTSVALALQTRGVIIVTETTNYGDSAIYLVANDATTANKTVTLIGAAGQGAGYWSSAPTTTPTAGHGSIAWDGATNYRLYNNTAFAGPTTFGLCQIKVG